MKLAGGLATLFIPDLPYFNRPNTALVGPFASNRDSPNSCYTNIPCVIQYKDQYSLSLYTSDPVALFENM